MTNIVPTVGRIVWFHPPSNSKKHGFEPTSICAATIAKVLPEGKLNLGVLDGNGVNHSMTDVPLIQEGETPPENGYYAEWMPFQKGQAAKTEELIKAAAASADPSPFSAAALAAK